MVRSFFLLILSFLSAMTSEYGHGHLFTDLRILFTALLYSRGPFDLTAAVAPLALPEPCTHFTRCFPCVFPLSGWGLHRINAGMEVVGR